MKRFHIILLIIFSFNSFSLFSQTETEKKENLPTYYDNKINFGFYMGLNRSNFRIQLADDWQTVTGDSLLSIRSEFKPGFCLGVVSELSLHKYITLRFVPNIAFSERNLVIDYQAPQNNTLSLDKRIQSTFIDFPLDLKLHSRRFGNFATYLLGGGRYTIDLSSRKNVNNANYPPAQQVMQLAKTDYGLEVGTGMDFFLPYFKFGIDFKYSYGLKNLLIKDQTSFSQAISSLQSQVFLISFTFEG